MATVNNATDPTDANMQDRIEYALAKLSKQRRQLADIATEGQYSDDVNASRLIKQAQETIDACEKVRITGLQVFTIFEYR